MFYHCYHQYGQVVSLQGIRTSNLTSACFSECAGQGAGALLSVQQPNGGNMPSTLSGVSCVISRGYSESWRTMYIDFGVINVQNINSSMVEAVTSGAAILMYTHMGESVAKYITITKCSGETVFDMCALSPKNVKVVNNSAYRSTLGAHYSGPHTISNCVIIRNVSPVIIAVFSLTTNYVMGATTFKDCYVDSIFEDDKISFTNCMTGNASPFTHPIDLECTIYGSFWFTSHRRRFFRMPFLFCFVL